jgi:hypothetical protein
MGLLIWYAALAITANQADPDKLMISLGNAGLTLAFGGVLGGLVKKLFDLWDERKTAHSAEQDFYRSMLDDLKSVYYDVEKARLLIEAHKSAKTYRDQMLILPDATIRLHGIRRALKPGFPKLRDELKPPINACIRFIRALTLEYRDNYLEISQLQSLDEVINKRRREAYSQSGLMTETIDFSDKAWRRIEQLEALQVLRLDYPDVDGKDRYDEYKAAFVDHIDEASRILRARLDGAEDAQKR